MPSNYNNARYSDDETFNLLNRGNAAAPSITSANPTPGQTPLSFAEASALAVSDIKNGALAKFDTQLAALYYSQSDRSVAMSAFTESVQQFSSAITTDGKYVVIDAIAQDGNGAALLAQLQSMGLMGGASFRGLASGYMPIANLGMLTTAANLASVHESALQTSVGNVTSQADHNQRDDVAKTTYGVDGTGLKIGVLSDSFATATGNAGGSGPFTTLAQDIASNDLPANTTILQDAISAATDEGRGMGQLIHDIAPGAAIAFHTANGGQANFAQGILDLAAAGSKVIVDDVSYFAELTYQNGVIAQAINQVVGQGVSYFSSAGNNSSLNTSTTTTVLGTAPQTLFPTGYQGNWVSGSAATINGISYSALMRFDVATSQDYLTVKTVNTGTQFFTLTWDDPGASAGGIGTDTDLDVYLVAANGTTLLTGAFANNVGGDPVEVFAYSGTNAAARVVVALHSGPAPTNIRIIDGGNGLSNMGFQVIGSNMNVGTLAGHHGSAGNIAVGAVPFYKASDVTEIDPVTGLGAFNPPVSETFSSLGKQTLIFDDNGNPMAPQTYGVDFSAVDGGNTTFFVSDTTHDSDTFPNFFGTSAAAPDAAATAILMLQANPGLTPADIRALIVDSTIPMVSTVQSGSGFIQADKAVGFGVSLNISNAQQTTLYGTHFGDMISGAGAADTIYGNGGNDTIFGYAGADTIYGGDGDDTINGNQDNDKIFGDAGNDTLIGGQGDDLVNGGAGDDLISGSVGNDILNGGIGFDTVTYDGATGGVSVSLGSGGGGTASGAAGNDTLYNFDRVIGSAFADYVVGGVANDVLVGGAGSDELHGSSGDDTLDGGAGAETQFANTIDRPNIIKAQATDISTAALAQVIQAASDFDLVPNLEIEQSRTLPHATVLATSRGLGGNDYYKFTVAAGATAVFDIDHYGLDANGNDSVIRLYNTDGVSQLATNDDDYADPGSDIYDSRLVYTFDTAGTYYLRVEGFANTTPAAGHTYTLNVSLSSATVTPDGTFTTGHDIIDGGAGFDTASYLSATAGVSVSLLTQGVNVVQNTGGAGMDELQSIENLAGSNFNDTLTGNTGANTISGGVGDDNIFGGDGNDVLSGDDGSDVIYGNVGADTLTGGIGNDFLYGGQGVDIVNGGVGNDLVQGDGAGDKLTGGDGMDTFRYALVSNSIAGAGNFDTITDFVSGTDKVDLSPVSTNPSDVYHVTSSGGLTFLDVDLGGNGSNEMHIEFTGANALVATDIIGAGTTVFMRGAESAFDDFNSFKFSDNSAADHTSGGHAALHGAFMIV